MKTGKQWFDSLGNRGEYAALPNITVEQIEAIQNDARAPLPDLRKYVDEQAALADQASKEWKAAGSENNADFRSGMWYAYNDVRNQLPL